MAKSKHREYERKERLPPKHKEEQEVNRRLRTLTWEYSEDNYDESEYDESEYDDIHDLSMSENC